MIILLFYFDYFVSSRKGEVVEVAVRSEKFDQEK